MRPTPIDDTQLWNAMLAGDQQSFAMLYDLYYGKLVNYGIKFTKELFVVEESIQDLFVKLWNNRSGISPTTSVKYYLYRSLRRILHRKLQAKRLDTSPIEETEALPFDIELSHDHELIRKERMEELKQKVDKLLVSLTNRQREAIFLRFYEDLSYEEIAELLEMNLGGTYKLIYRALDRLREQLGDFSVMVLALLLGVRVLKKNNDSDLI